MFDEARLKEEPAFAERARQLGNKDDDYIVEVYDALLRNLLEFFYSRLGRALFY
jgi:hypothetical protein